MLKQLHIRDFAVVEEADLELEPGFTTLTGETGAGKSILVDALALALGERADAQVVRAGQPRLEVTACFDLGDAPGAPAWLAENELDDGSGECLLRRVVTADGRSRAWINGRPVAVQTLREVGALLVDICGQQDYQSLRLRSVQRDVVDALGDLGGKRHAVAEAWSAWQAADTRHEELAAADTDRAERQTRLEYQVRELEALDPKAGEFPALEQAHRLLAHRARIAETLAHALARLYEDDGAAQDTLASAQDDLAGLTDIDPALEPAVRLLGEAGIQLREAAVLIRERLESLDAQPGREAELAERLAAFQTLARKHRLAPDELPDLRERLGAALEELTHYDSALEILARQAAERRAALVAVAGELTVARGKAAGRLARAVTKNMAELGMGGGRFTVALSPRAGDTIGTDGADEIEFLVTANPGQPPGPLSKVASGGELSRLNLAIQVVATAARGAPTLVFDEVDAGVGGAVAEIVGRTLRRLSATRQVLCITHLPQVASQAHAHATVTKRSRAGRTRTVVRMLSDAERIEETARMLGGVRITEQTRAHAREMLAG